MCTRRSTRAPNIHCGREPDGGQALGLTVDSIANTLRTQIEGRTIGTALEDGRRTPILVRGGETDTGGSDAAWASLPLTLSSGQHVALSQVAEIQRVDGPVKIDREDGNRMSVDQGRRPRPRYGRVCPGGPTEGRRPSFAAEGLSVSWGGQFENQQRAAARLSIVVPIAIGLIFVLLFTAFGSGAAGFVGACEHPFRLDRRRIRPGVWTGEYLSVPASVGFIALLGIAVLNGVVLVSYFNQLRPHGLAEDVSLSRVPSGGSGSANDSQHHRAGTDPTAVCFRTRIRDPAPAGHRGDRRFAVVDGADPDPVPILYRGSAALQRWRDEKRHGLPRPDRCAQSTQRTCSTI